MLWHSGRSPAICKPAGKRHVRFQRTSSLRCFHCISRYYAAPTIHHAILTSQPAGIIPSRDLRMRMIANAAGGLLPSLAVSLKSTFEAVILPSYGMTE
jgi:hypothetical protein